MPTLEVDIVVDFFGDADIEDRRIHNIEFKGKFGIGAQRVSVLAEDAFNKNIVTYFFFGFYAKA